MENADKQQHWEWRFQAVESLAQRLDMASCGVKALYLIGSVKRGEAGPCSDIDLLAHCLDDKDKQARLKSWCEGWGHALSDINRMKTGHEVKESLIDLHIITDKDVQEKDSFATLLDSVDDPARLVKKLEDD